MDDLSANFHALAVGVGAYKNQGFRNLPATVQDATLLRDTLLNPERCGYRSENVRILTGSEATLPRMRDELARLTQVSGPGSTVIIFFSGHGWRPHSASGTTGYLCLREADLLDMEGTALSAAEFSDAISALKAERVVVILDCCHASSTAQIKSPGGDQWKSGLPDAYYQALSTSGGGRVVIASCRDEEQSYVRPQGDYSYFTYHFVDALRASAGDDGFIRVVDVFDNAAQAVRSDVSADAQMRGDNFTQTPICKGQFERNFPIAYDQTGPQQAAGRAGAAQPTAAPPTPQPVAPNYGVQANVGTLNGNIFNADTMNFGPSWPKQD